jgi:hypothetical protein
VPAPPATTTLATRLTPIEGIKPNQISTLNTRAPLNPIPEGANLSKDKTWGRWGIGPSDPNIIQSDGVRTTSPKAPPDITTNKI